MSFRTPFRPLQSSLRLYPASSAWRSSIRYASLNSAIGRGIRKSQAFTGSRSSFEDNNDHYRGDSKPFRAHGRGKRDGHRPWSPEPDFDEDEFIRTGSFRALPREHQRFQNAPRTLKDRPPTAADRDRRPFRKNVAPEPQSKRRPERDGKSKVREASEFIYGTAAVEAALRCTRRQIYKLYIYQAAGEELSTAKAALRKLALSKNIKVKLAFAGWDRLLDKMSAGRPHNGCVLEASPLPRVPVQALKSVQLEDKHFRLELAPQTREEAVVNGTNDLVAINEPLIQQRRRYPVVLLLDGILDPGNLGAIIRSAYYLGVDAVVFAGRNSAPLSPVTIKASAGAAENMILLEVKNEVDFIRRSKANGWRFYAADAPNPGSTYIDLGATSGREGDPNPNSFVSQSPSVIMMGSEGSGLSQHVRSQADSIVSIPGARLGTGLGAASDPARVDSLNVSVAAALLMEMFLRLPLGVSDVLRKGKSQ
ncbi:hypothetical protein AOCH_003485 [Aspergillus ochraceoroseus]|uniref:rRNA methyltransferase 1, mitochondrial n=1 Tax=Aspergillus ochraceoroseus TaxID=138278 RepID=A0A0F8X3F8_9EURO|nr:hypothetical protein AOCH_003485 [Aspergillus ochraceoroseus]